MQAYLGSLVPTGYVSSLSAETPLQLLNHSCAGLHWRAERSERTVKTPRTCNGVRHLPHRTHQ